MMRLPISSLRPQLPAESVNRCRIYLQFSSEQLVCFKRSITLLFKRLFTAFFELSQRDCGEVCPGALIDGKTSFHFAACFSPWQRA